MLCSRDTINKTGSIVSCSEYCCDSFTISKIPIDFLTSLSLSFRWAAECDDTRLGLPPGRRVRAEVGLSPGREHDLVGSIQEMQAL